MRTLTFAITTVAAVCAFGISGCAGVAAQRAKDVSSAGVAYSQATAAVVDVAIGATVDASSQSRVLGKPRQPVTDPAERQARQDELKEIDKELIGNAVEYVRLKRSVGAIEAYFKALQELADFRMKYAQKVYGPMMAQAAGTMTQAMAMYPQMKDAMAKFADEAKKLDGTPLLTESIFIAVASPQAQSAQADQKAEPAPGIGGLLGGLGRFRRGKNNDQPAGGGTPTAAGGGAPGRTTIMTTTTETLQITPAATDADVALPAGLKLK